MNHSDLTAWDTDIEQAEFKKLFYVWDSNKLKESLTIPWLSMKFERIF